MKTFKTIKLDSADLRHIARELASYFEGEIIGEGLNRLRHSFNYSGQKFTVMFDVECKEILYAEASYDQPRDAEIVIDFADVTCISVDDNEVEEIEYSNNQINSILTSEIK